MTDYQSDMERQIRKAFMELEAERDELRAKLDVVERASAEMCDGLNTLADAFQTFCNEAGNSWNSIQREQIEKARQLTADAGRADLRVAQAREGMVPVEDVRRAVQFADRYVAAEGDEYMKWLRAKHPNLFTK